jgi:hypothetical protein
MVGWLVGAIKEETSLHCFAFITPHVCYYCYCADFSLNDPSVHPGLRTNFVKYYTRYYMHSSYLAHI